MRHLIVSREYPPASYPPGGIGAYVAAIARLLAERGETVHVIAERWKGAPLARESLHGGRLTVHRIGEQDLPAGPAAEAERRAAELAGLRGGPFPMQWFSWSAALLAERLIVEEGIDVIEGQEWEAPLHHLLLRRALGFGPDRAPPCIVHLHSATAFIRRYNGVLTSPPSYGPMTRTEAFCIGAADALLCPSRYYARQCVRRFGLADDAVRVIPLPVGFTPFVERDAAVWADGPICFVGRLEPRKGVIEWVRAAAEVAATTPGVTFDFVGGDTHGLLDLLIGRIPAPLRPRFRFHGSQPHERVVEYLAGARAAVVPSRWENFPVVCIEAMRSGLPVIATRLGGMVEMIEDGRTGWLAPDDGVAGMTDGLAGALRRCLAASPAERAAMGRAASESVSRLCDNAAVVEAHLAFRAEVAARGAARSRTGPVFGASRAGDGAARARRAAGPTRAGVVVRARTLAAAAGTLASLRGQTAPPAALAVVCDEPPDAASRATAEADGATQVLHRPGSPGPAAWNAGFAALGREAADFWLFLDADDALEPDCLARLGAALAHRPELGLVTPWTARTVEPPALDAPPCPDVLAQLRDNDAAPATAFRAAALAAEAPFRPGLPREYDVWDLANRVLLAGWAGAVLPEALARRRVARARLAWPEASALRAIRAELLAPYAAALPPDALELIADIVPAPDLAAPAAPSRMDAFRALAHRLLALALDPARLARAIRKRVPRAPARGAGRPAGSP